MSADVTLRLFVLEHQRHAGQPLYQWLLRRAAELGLPGGSAFRAIAGYGRHRTLHEAHFYELAGELPMEVVFVATRAEAQRLLADASAEGLSLRYVLQPAESGVTGDG